MQAPLRPVKRRTQVSNVDDIGQCGYGPERPFCGHREGVRLRATFLDQVETLAEWPAENAAGAKRPDAIGREVPELSLHVP